MELYFKDTFFSSGKTEILDVSGQGAGMLDLKGALGSSIDVFDKSGQFAYGGGFRFFSNKWIVKDSANNEIGMLRYRFSFLSKRFTYETSGRGTYEITSPAFSKEYEIADDTGRLIARFDRVSSWLLPSAYRLVIDSSRLGEYELVCVVMGMHEIQKRHNN